MHHETREHGGTYGVVKSCEEGQGQQRRGSTTRERQVGTVDARGGGSSHFSHLCSFPDPSPKRTGRPRCPPMRNG
eukprot:scaffold138705_cov136-Phaeocystis_antarctica.AAC.1